MSRELPPGGDPEEDQDGPPPEPTGRVRTTGPGPLVGFGLAGLVVGWALRPLSIRLTGSAPFVGWLPVLAMLFVALLLLAVAWATYRALHRPPDDPLQRKPLAPHQAVNRLVLAKASALVGAMVAGGYFGYALSWWGVVDTSQEEQRLVQSLVGGAAGLLVLAGSLLLERACRVRREDPDDLG